jgi:hypothetical protein
MCADPVSTNRHEPGRLFVSPPKGKSTAKTMIKDDSPAPVMYSKAQRLFQNLVDGQGQFFSNIKLIVFIGNLSLVSSFFEH